MTLISTILIAFVAVLHIYILVLEMFLWEKPVGLKAFRNTPEKAAITRILAANQGLYNGFLAAGLIWGLCLGEAGTDIKFFFLGCIMIAGIYGAFTASRKIFFIQTLPALLGVICLYVAT
ncbi:MAG TPA: DUF1304 domain-containing protein [Cellvibrio sp.]|nr:DUF1304 domain-containing protein [Cellvibrio sp.]